ncbi:hypothetical protein Taro_050957 [Colocasia esculenta]|uniref:Uncharacterized protein n=1 Tax=Colocasia esculenta TaxID=4460 RepID=A0A843XFI3_COLES|nr:hypothetical protein [Colocasia esculenta]
MKIPWYYDEGSRRIFWWQRFPPFPTNWKSRGAHLKIMICRDRERKIGGIPRDWRELEEDEGVAFLVLSLALSLSTISSPSSSCYTLLCTAASSHGWGFFFSSLFNQHVTFFLPLPRRAIFVSLLAALSLSLLRSPSQPHTCALRRCNYPTLIPPSSSSSSSSCRCCTAGGVIIVVIAHVLYLAAAKKKLSSKDAFTVGDKKKKKSSETYKIYIFNVLKQPKAKKKLPSKDAFTASDKKKKSSETYKIYIFKVLKQVLLDISISNKARIINSFINHIFEKLT